jgi:hypothetical protein
MNNADVQLLLALLEIAAKARTAIEALKQDKPEAYDYVSKHHASALQTAMAIKETNNE